MSNNTSNYQKYTFPKLLEQYDKILVPMIQRDYAQGRTDKKAEDVRNNLLNDIFSGNEVHFNLVFGSKEKRIIDGEEKNCFIPVDGQQRLTTLFLLHLYGQKAGKTNTELYLSKFSYDTRRAASDFCKSITSEEWAVPNDKNVSDVIKDFSWFMNYWEKDPTVEGMLNMLDAIHKKCKKITDYPNLEKVTFFFFDLESNGLNENLYLKMNSRGKPLTAFENLKAKMEKVLPEDIEIEDKCFPKCDASPKDSFKAKWKYFMDRNWTEAFWDKEHPENYDESITKFIVRFLAGYWAAYGTDEEQMAKDLQSLNSKDSYADFIPFEPIKIVLDLEKAFPKLAYALTTAPKITPYWSNDAIKVSDKSEYKFLAVIFTYVLFDGDKDAMRFAWNMAENYVTGYDNYITFCERAKEILDSYKPEPNAFYKTLSNHFFTNPSEQLKEEIAKAKQILDESGNLRKHEGSCKKEDGSAYHTWEEIINDAEKLYFFKGAIAFLFNDVNGQPTAWNHFDHKLEIAKQIFDAKGLRKDYLINTLLCLYSYCDQWDDQLCWSHKIFNGLATTWKENILTLTDRNRNYQYVYASPVHHILMGYEPRNRDEINDNRIKTLANCSLIEYIINKQKEYNKKDMYIRSPHDALYFCNAKRGVLLSYDDRNKVILEMMLKDTRFQLNNKDVVIPNTNLLWGFDIDIIYKEQNKTIYFRWYRERNNQAYDIYLMDNNWNYIHRPNKKETEQGDRKDYYCFNVDTKTANVVESIIEKLKSEQSEIDSNT